MMIAPITFIDELKDADYDTLIKERDELIRAIRSFEESDKRGDRSGEEWNICPSSEVRYQCNLEYLAELCAYMKEKYNEEYVWGDKRLLEGS